MTLVLIVLLVAALGAVAYLSYVLKRTIDDLDESREETRRWFNKAVTSAVNGTRTRFALEGLMSILAVDEDGKTIPRGPDEWRDPWAQAAEFVIGSDLDPESPPVYKTGSARVVIRA